MQVYVSVDMEGISGIATRDQVVRGGYGYRRAQALMTSEVNAAIEGAFDGGAESVLVNDAHGTMDNLLPDELDPRARLLLGVPKPDGMVEGLTATHDVAFFVGYHAAAGTGGVLAHTFSSHLIEVRVNGAAVSEAEVNAMRAASAGVPVGLLTGDDVMCAAARDVLPGITAVEVKRSCGVYAVDSLSPDSARTRIRAAAARVVSTAGMLRPVDVSDLLDVEVEMPLAAAAENGAMMPGVRRMSQRTVRAEFTSPHDLIGFITLCCQLAESAMKIHFHTTN
ncbi:MAG: M55 family metallopeptidase [Nocardioidaceae bacterium]